MKANKRSRSGARVNSIFIALAFVNLLTVALGLIASLRTSKDYRLALQENRRSAEQLASFQSLRKSALRVSTATVGVFVSRDAVLQKRELDAAVAGFESALLQAREAQQAAYTNSRVIDDDHQHMQASMAEMVATAKTIFALAAENNTAAAAQLPNLDKAYARLMMRIEANSQRVRTQQQAAFVRQSAAHESMIRNDAMLSALVAIFVVAVAVYGIRFVRVVGSAREREAYIAALQNAIEERDAQQKIREAHEELLLEAEQIGMIGTFNWDIVHDAVYWSDALCRILGVPEGTSDANYELYLSRVHHDDRARVKAVVDDAVTKAERFSFEHRWVRPAGDIRVISVKGKIETTEQGLASRMIGVVRDVTEQRLTTAKLQRHEAQLEEAQRIARIGSWDWNPETNTGTWSDEIFHIAGCSPETTEPSFDSYVALIHPDDRMQFLSETLDRMQTHRERVSQEHRLLRPDGTIVHVSLHSRFSYTADGELAYGIGTVQDVTERKRIEESLRISEERFVFAAKATNEVIWDWNALTNKLSCNDAFAVRYGHHAPSTGEYEMWHWLNHIHPDERNAVWESFQRATAGADEYWSAEYRILNSVGEWRDVLDRGYLLRGDDGKVVRVIGASQDITERKRAAEELARLHQQNKLVLDSTVDAIFGIDRNGRINLVNATASRMFGWMADELIGQDPHTILRRTAPDCDVEATLVGGKLQRTRDVLWHKDGTAVPVECTANPMIDDNGAIVGIVVTCTDITERLKIDRMKDEFVSTVSHELRTPLTAIRGALGLLSTGRVGTFADKAQRLLDIAATNTDRLVRLINDILDIEKLDNGKLTLAKRAIAVDDVIEQAVLGVRPLLDRAQIQVNVDAAKDVVSLDPDRIVQTLTNLLSNAIKFSPAGSTIRVTAQRKGDDMVFAVSDEGRGIPVDKLESIFERFEQVDASDSRDKGGSGLGLAICRSIIRQHGGVIRAESEPGHGSTFTFNIPAPVAEPARTGTKRKKVLIAGASSFRACLEESSFDVREVATGDDVVNAVRNDTPDVMLVMPDANGFALLAAIKNDAATADVPVVLIGEEFDRRDGIRACLPKHVSQDALVAALKGACDPNPRPRLLIVEDDVDLARVISALFERYDVETTIAATGREAVQFAQEKRPDLVILDLVLPEIDGFGVVNALRTDDRCRNVPLLVYSALEPSASQREHLKLGPTEFLTKSLVTPEELERRVAALLNTIIRERGDLFDAA